MMKIAVLKLPLNKNLKVLKNKFKKGKNRKRFLNLINKNIRKVVKKIRMESLIINTQMGKVKLRNKTIRVVNSLITL